MKKAKIDLARWNELSSADQDILRQLGVEPKIPRKTADEKKPTCPDEEYFLKITKLCDCCRTKEILTGKMRQLKPHHTYLSYDQSVGIPEGEIFRQKVMRARTCNCCDEVLGQKSQDELVKMVKMLHERINI